MAIRGSVTLECDSPKCQAEQVIGDLEMADDLVGLRGGVEVTIYADGWVLDDDGLLHCPQCCEEARNPRDDAYERAAARARNNDFAETGGKDWT